MLRLFENMGNSFTHMGKCSECGYVREFTLADGLKWVANNDVQIICKKNVSFVT